MTRTFQKIMEGMGLQESEENKDLLINSRDLKEKLMEMLKESKKGAKVNDKDLKMIYHNLPKLDHHDAVRLDQILTMMANEKENDYQWASICMNKKFKKL